MVQTMNDNEIIKYKKNLMKMGWVEERHHELEKLTSQDAKAIVESMNEVEVYRNVNVRRHQEDYIVEYLAYLWEISETAFWKHVTISLNVREGLLWGDDMQHFEKMCRLKIPDDVFKAVLDFAIECDEKIKQDLEAIGCVIRAQVDKFGRLDEIKHHISLLDKDKQTVANTRIDQMLITECPYNFY